MRNATLLSSVLGLCAFVPIAAADRPRTHFQDDFAAGPATGWRWLREHADFWRLRDGALEIRVEPGVADTVRNALVRPAPDRSRGAFAAEVTVTNLSPPTTQYEQAGITWYVDGKPAVKLVKELIDGKLYIIPGKVPLDAQTVQLRLVVTADSYTAQFRPDGRGEFVTAGTGALPPAKGDEVSIQCYNGPADAEHWIRFDDFRITELTAASHGVEEAGGSAGADMPADWRGTPVGPDGGLQYDPRGSQSYGTRITPGVSGGFTEIVRQESELPARARVVTTGRRYQLECITEAYAVTLPAASQPDDAARAAAQFRAERVGQDTVLLNWAAPQPPGDPAFAHIAVGWNEPVAYRVRAMPASAGGCVNSYTVVFGLCEGHHTRAGQRPLELRIEGRTRRTVDPIAEHGRNVPAAYAFDAKDENGDGWIEIAAAPVPGAPDQNAILNVLWVFSGAAESGLPLLEVIAGKHNAAAWAFVPCGEGLPPAPRDDVLKLTLRAPAGVEIVAVPTLTIETGSPVEAEPKQELVRITGRTAVVCPEPIVRVDRYPGRTVLVFRDRRIPAGGETALIFGVHRGAGEYAGPTAGRQ